MRAATAEAFGTFALTLVAAGAETVARVSHGEPGQAARAVAPGLMVMALVYAFGACSGAHVNPGVTLTFALKGAFPWRRLPTYGAFQVGGATLAALALRGLFGEAASAGVTRPRHGDVLAFWMELLLAPLPTRWCSAPPSGRAPSARTPRAPWAGRSRCAA